MIRILALVIVLGGCGGGGKPAPTAPVPEGAHEHRADEELQGECDRKQIQSCLDLGARYADGEDGVEVDHPRAGKLFERACELGSQDGCASFAMGIAQGVTAGDPARAYALLEKACGANVKKGCRGVGFLEFQGKGTQKDVPGALAVLTKTCDANDGTSCGVLAVVYINEQKDNAKAAVAAKRGCDLDSSFACFVAAGLTSSPDEVLKLLSKACDLGDGEACTGFGASLLVGAGIKADGARAVTILDRGCKLGDIRACRALGGALFSALPDITPDDARAAAALKRACDGGDLSGCAVLGVAYATGRGVPESATTAYALFKRSCDEGTTEATATGCYYLGMSYYKGHGAPQSYTEAAKYFEIACTQSWGEACAVLGEQYELGQGFKADAAKAAEYHHRACELDHAPSCTKPRTP